MNFGKSILTNDGRSYSTTLNAGSYAEFTFNTTRIAELSEHFRLEFAANQYNNAIGTEGMYTPTIKVRVIAVNESGDAFEYMMYPIRMEASDNFQLDIRVRSGKYTLFKLTILNDSASSLSVTSAYFRPESLEEVITEVKNYTDESINGFTQTLDLKVTQVTDGEGRTHAYITLSAGGRDYTGTLLIEGNLQVSGQLSAEELYAAMGDIADLTVDKLSTSRRIVKYLAKDTSDDNYLEIQDEHIHFMAGIYASGEEQAKNPFGLPLYWESDPNAPDVVLGKDGYPYYNGIRIFTTTSPTSYPVKVYTYNETTKGSFEYGTTDEGYYMPILTLGAGNNTGNNKAVIVKDSDCFSILYSLATGKKIGMYMDYNSGFTDIYGLRKTVAMDFSGWESGFFTETVQGETEPIRYTVTFDGSGNPIKISDGENECTITW